MASRKRPRRGTLYAMDPRRFGPYQVVRELGRGATGTVYEVTAEGWHGSRLALKTVRSQDPKLRERLRREAELLARADGHPGLVRVHSSGEQDGVLYVVLDLVEGEPLDARVARGPLPWREAVAIAATLGEALASLHGRGIVHRDVKPGNVILDTTGVPKLLDLGVAHALDLERLTVTGALVGTPLYMAPEALRPNATPDARLDVYSLGACLYELLSGEPPFPASSLPELLAAIASGRCERPCRHQPDAPRALDAVVLATLEADRARRYASCADLAGDLRAIARGDPPRRLPRGGAGRRAVAVALAATALPALGLWLGLRADVAPPRRPDAPAPPAPPRAARPLVPGRDDRAIERALAAAERHRQGELREQGDLAALVGRARGVHGALLEARKAGLEELPPSGVAFITSVVDVCARREAFHFVPELTRLALELDPRQPRLRNDLASYLLTHVKPPRAGEALELVRPALDDASLDPVWRGRCFRTASDALYLQDQRVEARAVLERGAATLPDGAVAPLLVALARRRLEEGDRDVIETTARLLRQPRDAESSRRYAYHAQALALGGRHLEALEAIALAMRGDLVPRDEDLAVRGASLLAVGRVDDAWQDVLELERRGTKLWRETAELRRRIEAARR